MMFVWWLWTIIALSTVAWGILHSYKLSWRHGLAIVGVVLCRWMYASPFEQAVVGHSTQYLEVYEGMIPTIGDSTFYPSLQVLWWLLGRLSFGAIPPQLWSSLVGALSIVLLSSNTKKLYWLPMVWLTLLPEHMFWSGSIYNVVWPLGMGVVALRFAQSEKWNWLGCAMGLSVAWRIETLLFWGVLIAYIPFWDWRVLFKCVGGTLLSLALLYNMQIPGDGEYLESLKINLFFTSYYRSYWVPLLFGIFCVGRKRLALYVWFLLWALCHHGILSTFNDFSSRHVLVLAVVLVHALKDEYRNRFVYGLLWGGAISANLFLLWSNHSAFTQQESEFETHILEQAMNPEQLTLSQAQSRGCAWIVEMEPFSEHPTQRIRSHFNLLQQQEVEALFRQYECIDWCYTIQDWAWSELGVEDRATRLEYLYEWDNIAVVAVDESTCLLRSMKVDRGYFSEIDSDHKHSGGEKGVNTLE